VRRRLRRNTANANAEARATNPAMKKGTQLSPAESAAISGTDRALVGLPVNESGELADSVGSLGFELLSLSWVAP
jgi:hypothetical protein